MFLKLVIDPTINHFPHYITQNWSLHQSPMHLLQVSCNPSNRAIARNHPLLHHRHRARIVNLLSVDSFTSNDYLPVFNYQPHFLSLDYHRKRPLIQGTMDEILSARRLMRDRHGNCRGIIKLCAQAPHTWAQPRRRIATHACCADAFALELLHPHHLDDRQKVFFFVFCNKKRRVPIPELWPKW